MQEKRTSAELQDVPRPVAVHIGDSPVDAHHDRHSHARGQLIYAINGVMLVVTDQASFVVPPLRALWVPGGVEHEVYNRGKVLSRSLYIDEKQVTFLPTACRIIEVTPLLRELILAAAELPVEYDISGRGGWIMSLILSELQSMRVLSLDVPMPKSERLVRICTQLLKDPAQNQALDHWAAEAAMGRRTFTRSFRRETGISFADWCRNARLMEALSRLSLGQSVTVVAHDVGYSSSSAFGFMFRRAFGVSPRRFLAGLAAGAPPGEANDDDGDEAD
ncbi:AraC family transcriptional regulator [Roseiterribacter gracilis]|uniref:Transcriptional regulator n=1 Tax=Roseiterribacter gracilis TaxID=2812848 RepID=A0A8S8XEF5_9PROT|nr:transcriptional regulator [Rhodospirillales bacterium TMPK1]